MSLIGARLEAHWRAQGIEPPPGVGEARLREFESLFSISLPPDMRGYFLRVNGMGSSSGLDHDLFNFWPLDEVVPACDHYPDQFIEDQASYFVFADHSIALPDYAIRLTASEASLHPVVAIYSDQRKYSTSMVARSFSEFVERYLSDEMSRDDLSMGMPVGPG
jgi:hypothetical protein